eukprot:1581611-Amphidinium_carterae.1
MSVARYGYWDSYHFGGGNAPTCYHNLLLKVRFEWRNLVLAGRWPLQGRGQGGCCQAKGFLETSICRTFAVSCNCCYMPKNWWQLGDSA